MVSWLKLDRREFLSISALATAAILLPNSLHADRRSEPGLVSLRVSGDAESGYGVPLLFRDQPIARHHHGAEFSAIFQNFERSLEDRVEDWKAASSSGDSKRIKLTGVMQLPNLRTNVLVEVTYEVMTPQVVKKTIGLRQADMYTLFYQLTNRLEPEAAFAKLWSFDHPECKGGPLHEYFPAAGFRTASDVTVGLLTDSGYRNQWSRIIRRDGIPVKPAPFSTPEPESLLSSLCGRTLRARRIYPADFRRGNNSVVRRRFPHASQSSSGFHVEAKRRHESRTA